MKPLLSRAMRADLPEAILRRRKMGFSFPFARWLRGPPAMGRPPASVTIETDDCRKTVEELKSRGVEFVSDVLEFPWGYVAQFQDLDGNRLRVATPR